jgi:uncharacterized protein DUF6941
MKVHALLLADSVQEVGGKLYMLGGAWNILNVGSFPTNQLIGIGVAIDIGWNETNQKHRLEIHVEDADGSPLPLRIEAEFEAGRPPGISPGSDIRIVMAVNGPLEIAKSGTYSLILKIADEEMARATFQAVPKN